MMLKQLIRTLSSVGLLLLLLTNPSGGAQVKSDLSRKGSQAKQACLPTGVCLDAAGHSFSVGNMPLAMILSPEADRVVISLNGWREQGVQIVERSTGRILQTIPQPGAFLGLVFSADGQTLYASGGNEDVVYRYAWHDKQAKLIDSLVLAAKQPKKDGTRYPAGIAISHDGRRLYVAENLADSLAVIDLNTKLVVQHLPTQSYPYGVTVAPDGKVYVSAWGGDTVSIFKPDGNSLKEHRRIVTGRHPSALLLNRSGSRLFVASASTSNIAVVDTLRGKLLANLSDAPPSGPNEGSTPNALALSEDGSKLFVAEADNNAVAVFDLSKTLSDVKSASGRDRIMGRIPVEWYPTALLMTKDFLFVLNGKGRGTRPNPNEVQSGTKLPNDSTDYVLGQLNGTLTRLPARINARDVLQFTNRVARANNWDRPTRVNGKYPPFKHVIYIIKENRTFDQVLSDMPQGDGDKSLLFFPRPVSPNHHAIAARFGLFDRFFVNAEVSSQGHVWTTAAYVTDYGEKTTPSGYSFRRDGNDRGDVDEPAAGYLWNAAIRKKLTLRNYGEFAEPLPDNSAGKNQQTRYHATKSALNRYTNPDYPSFDMKISDQLRADIWLKEFEAFVQKGNLPSLEIVHLPRDHTAGARAGLSTPKACMADNDFALGRMVAAVSNSRYWKDTVLFVLEDDAQDGPDHVDSHRSVLFVISAYNRGGAFHRFVNTTDVLATVEEILGLEPLSQFDYFGRPLREIFSDTPDMRPYTTLKPEQPLDQLNPGTGTDAQASAQLNFDQVDAADEDLFNQVLWRAIKGELAPYPGTKRMSALEITRAH